MKRLRKATVAALVGFAAMESAAESAGDATTIGVTAQGGASQTCFGSTLFVQAAAAPSAAPAT